MSKDARIGLFVIALALLLSAINSLREAGVVTFGSQIGLIFSQVHGLRSGDSVTIGGVPRGRVVSIDFAPKEIQEALAPLTGGVTLVRAQVAFSDFRKIPRDSTYAVRTDLNGRRWIEITVSPSEVEIGPDEIFFSEESASQDDQLQATIGAFAALGKQTENLRDVLSDPDFRLRTKDTASNLRFYSRELRAASAEAPGQLRAFEKNLDAQEKAIQAQVEAFDEKTREVRQRMTEMAPQISENLQGWSARISRQGDRLTATLQLALERSEEYKDLLDKLMQQSLKPEAVQALVVQTKKWARKIEEYRFLAEDLHALTSDPVVRSDLKVAISKLVDKSAEIDERLRKLEKQIDENPLKPMLGIPESEPVKLRVTPIPAPQSQPTPQASPAPSVKPTPAIAPSPPGGEDQVLQ